MKETRTNENDVRHWSAFSCMDFLGEWAHSHSRIPVSIPAAHAEELKTWDWRLSRVFCRSAIVQKRLNLPSLYVAVILVRYVRITFSPRHCVVTSHWFVRKACFCSCRTISIREQIQTKISAKAGYLWSSAILVSSFGCQRFPGQMPRESSERQAMEIFSFSFRLKTLIIDFPENPESPVGAKLWPIVETEF